MPISNPKDISVEDSKKSVEALENLFTAGDAWLRRHGMHDNPIAHNSIVLNLYMNFPKVKYVEYFLGTDPDNKRIRVVMHYSFWNLLFMKKEAVIDDVIELLRDYLQDFDIVVELRRYKKGVEHAKATITGDTVVPSIRAIPRP